MNNVRQKNEMKSSRKSNEVENEEILWNVDENELPKSYSGLIQIYSAKTETSFNCVALGVYSPRGVVELESKTTKGSS